ncbi:MAG: ABC transporter permease [Bacteroidetes bacterium]|nr:MAG: ABC transporter permease [Bacteroidota bacterium]
MSLSFWKKYRKNPLGMIGLGFILLTAFFGIFAVFFAPDKSPNANAIQLQISTRLPGFQAWILKEPIATEPVSFSDFFTGRPASFKEYVIDSWYWNDGKPYAFDYLDEGIPGEKLNIAVAQYPLAQDSLSFAKAYIENRTFYLGTDRFGRDMLSRMLLGARISLAVGLIAVAISLLLGIVLGSLAGYFGGWVDKAIMWLINVIWSLPTLLLVIALTLVLGKGFWQIFVAVGMSMWVDVARLVRGQVMSLKEKEFVESAKVLGIGHGSILFRHILPNLTGPLTVVAAANFASAILLEAGLSFLGLGVQAPVASWGQMIKEHFGYIVLDSAYLALVPGLAIMLLVMSFNFVGNALRDSLDVRLK